MGSWAETRQHLPLFPTKTRKRSFPALDATDSIRRRRPPFPRRQRYVPYLCLFPMSFGVHKTLNILAWVRGSGEHACKKVTKSGVWCVLAASSASSADGVQLKKLMRCFVCQQEAQDANAAPPLFFAFLIGYLFFCIKITREYIHFFGCRCDVLA